MIDPRWCAVAQLVRGLARVVEQISYSIPPLDDFDVEILKAHWYLDEIQKLVRENRRQERMESIRLVYGVMPGKVLE